MKLSKARFRYTNDRPITNICVEIISLCIFRIYNVQNRMTGVCVCVHAYKKALVDYKVPRASDSK